MPRLFVSITGLVLVLGSSTQCRQQDADNGRPPEGTDADAELAWIRDPILAAWDRHKTMRAKIATETQEPQLGASYRGKGMCEVRNDGDDTLIRYEMTMDTIEREGKTTDAHEKLIAIIDGRHAHSFFEAGRGEDATRRATKSRLDRLNPGMCPDPRLLFEMLTGRFNVKGLSSEVVNDSEVHVLEAQRKTEPESSWRFYFDKQTGAILKWVKNVGGTATVTSRYSDFEFDVPIPDERFDFKPPPGVEIIDATKQE
jgi:hypothetical protein